MRELRPLLAAALHPQWTIGLVHWGIAWTRKLPEASPTLATLFSREREECVPHFDGSDASLLDAGSSLFFANLFARRRRASASKPALGTRSGLTHRVVTGSERADVVARTAVVRIRRRIAAARIGVRRRGVDAGVAGWTMVGLDSIEPQKSDPRYTGNWRIEVPRLVAVDP